MTLKKGDRVITTGLKKTKFWGAVLGKITNIKGNSVFVEWEGSLFPIEEEMEADEVKLYTGDQ
jgi:cell shape-determining protein MreC